MSLRVVPEQASCRRATARRRWAWPAAWAGAWLALLAVPLLAQTDGSPAVRADAGRVPAGAGSAPGEARQCAEGVITEIDVESRSIFDPSSTSIAPLAWTYGLLNLLHVNTNESFIRGELLFAEGDCFDSFLYEESYRLLDQHGFLNVDEMRVEDDGAGGRRISVATRDEWSTKVDIGVTYDAGANLETFEVTEENFLGHGVFFEFTHYQRRETRNQALRLRTPRFFGRSDAGIAVGSSRSGRFIDQYWRYPFVGEANRIAVRQGYAYGTDFYAYATDGAEPFQQVLLPVRREFAEISGAYRFGDPGESIVLGASLTRDVVTFPHPLEITFGDFDDREPLPGGPPVELARQLRETSATRAAVHVGTMRFRIAEYVGLDDLRARDRVSLGMYAGITVGRTLGILNSSRAPAEDDFYARGHLSFTHPIGSSLVHGGATIEARHVEAGWRDALGEAELVAFGRNDAFASHTLFFRASASGGWETTLPYQLALGGREGVRSLDEDRYPGGRMLRFVLEDRIVLPWPPETADLGLTFFGDLGRAWPGDVPYGVDSGWQAALGFGLRIGLPRGSRHIYRTDIAFPVGRTHGGPIFRVTFELNKLRSGFVTPDVVRSRRFRIGPETFFY
jgi:hypothetical protein